MKNLTLVIPAKTESDSLPIVLKELKDFECKKIQKHGYYKRQRIQFVR